jgi:hypothetical protein
MLSRQVLGAGARVSGTRGTMGVLSPYVPQLGHRLVVRSNTRRAVEHVHGSRPPLPVSCGRSLAPSCVANLCSPDQTMRLPT